MNAVIRLARPGDAGAVAAIYRPHVEGSAVSFEVVAPDATEMARRIEATLPAFPWLVAAGAADEVLGYAYASRLRDRAAYQWAIETTVYVRASDKRRGLGRTLYGALLPLLRLQGFRTAFGGITLPNPGSVGLHEALGFTHVGTYHGVGHKLGAWHDVGFWQLDLAARDPAPAPPRRLAELLEHPELRALRCG